MLCSTRHPFAPHRLPFKGGKGSGRDPPNGGPGGTPLGSPEGSKKQGSIFFHSKKDPFFFRPSAGPRGAEGTPPPGAVSAWVRPDPPTPGYRPLKEACLHISLVLRFRLYVLRKMNSANWWLIFSEKFKTTKIFPGDEHPPPAYTFLYSQAPTDRL